MDWIERHRNILSFSLASLFRRKGKNTVLLLVYILVVFMLASVLLFSSAIRQEAQIVLQEAPEMVVQRIAAGRHDLIPTAYIPQIASIRGVQDVKHRLWGYYYHPAAKANFTVLAQSDFPHADDEVIVGDGVMRLWGSKNPDGLYFKTYNGQLRILKVVGSFPAGTDLVASDLIITSEKTFRALFGIDEHLATDLTLTVRNENEIQVISEKINQRLPDVRTISREEILRTYAAVFDWRSGYIIVILSMAGLAFFIFAWDKATGLSAEEKKEIGILKAVGWDTSDVLLMKFWEGTAISLTAFWVGLILAYVHVQFADATMFEHALKGWSTLYPNFDFKSTVTFYQAAILFFLTVAPYSLVTVIPTWSAAVSDPDAVMRQ